MLLEKGCLNKKSEMIKKKKKAVWVVAWFNSFDAKVTFMHEMDDRLNISENNHIKYLSIVKEVFFYALLTERALNQSMVILIC